MSDAATLDVAEVFRQARLQVDADPTSCTVASADIAAPAPQPAAAVLLPRTEPEVVRLVHLARQERIALFPKGGGWSYTAGYQPQGRRSAIVDTRHLQTVVIDTSAGIVEAGAGVTWATLHEALAAAGRRACSFGPLSGIGATVGGGAAQNGGFFGAAGHGAYGDGTICGGRMVSGTGDVHVLQATDRIDGIAAPQPLVGDCGAFGIRTTVVLRTMPTPEATEFASFDFPSAAAAVQVLASLAGLPGLAEAYVFDPGTHANLARTGFSVIESAGLVDDLLRGTGGLAARLGGLVRTARAGKAFVAELNWSLHLSFDGTRAEVTQARAAATERAVAADGEIIPDVIPRVTRARPFRRIKALLGPDGEAWLPVHGVFAAARGGPALAAVEATLASEAATMAKHGIRTVILAVLMGPRVVIEPQLFWPDGMTPAVRAKATTEQLDAFAARPDNPAARTAAHTLRRRLIETLDHAGATHFQIGRAYAAHPGVPGTAQAAWLALKQKLDPNGIMNPGVLGL